MIDRAQRASQADPGRFILLASLGQRALDRKAGRLRLVTKLVTKLERDEGRYRRLSNIKFHERSIRGPITSSVLLSLFGT